MKCVGGETFLERMSHLPGEGEGKEEMGEEERGWKGNGIGGNVKKWERREGKGRDRVYKVGVEKIEVRFGDKGRERERERERGGKLEEEK